MQVRTYYDGFRLAAANFFDNLLPKVVDLQFTRGGPIIAVQVGAEVGRGRSRKREILGEEGERVEGRRGEKGRNRRKRRGRRGVVGW